MAGEVCAASADVLPAVGAGAGLLLMVALQAAADAELPVSLDRIRAALARPAPTLVTEPADPAAPTFTVHIQERAPDPGIVPALDFKSVPAPPSGLYPQMAGHPIAEQPLVSIDVIPLAHTVAHAIGRAWHASAEKAARDEVHRELVAFCAARGCRTPG